MDIQKTLNQLRTNLNCWAAVIMKPNADMTEMICTVTSNLPEDWAEQTNLLDGNSMNSKCYMQNLVVVNNDENFSIFGTATTSHRVYAAAVVPIQKHGKVIGTLELLSDTEEVTFEEAEIRAMKATATKLAELI